MSEYIPTTGVIRAGYQIARDTEDNLISFREFNSWLEQHDAEIVAKAEERIIKLLEDSEVRAKWIEATSKSLPTYQGVVDFFTSLIKGEQK